MSNELFSDESVAPEDQERPRRHERRSRSKRSNRIGLGGFGRLGFSVAIVLATFAGVTAAAVVTASPAFAAQALSCIDPASGGSTATFHAGVSSFYTVECEEETGISGTSAYPTIAVNTSNLPADGNPALATGSGCTTGTSGSGASEEYIEECKYSDTPTAADENATAYTANFTATPTAFTGSSLTPITSGTLSITVNAPTVTCIDPASGGSSTTFYTGSTNGYTVECEEQSGITSDTAYPSSIAIASGSFPADGNPAFATSTSSSPACTTGTSGSGATEEYILECALSDTPTSSDVGSYPFTFTATGAGGVGSVTSGTLTVTVSTPTTTCSTPASGGTTATWVDGTAETETLICYSQGFATANAGNYPASITLNSGSIPSDASEATTTTSSPACTTATSGSGTSEEYELECKITDTPVTADNGTYHATFLATGGANGAPNLVSGTLTINVNQPAPSWETDGSTDGNYMSAIKGVPFCFDLAVTTSTSGGASSGSPYSLPLTSLTAGTTPSGVANYAIQNVNLAAGTAQICGTNNNNAASAPVTMAPVATNSGGSATDSVPLWSQGECTWTTTSGTISMFDTNQDLEQAGSQSAFGAAITNGVTGGTSKNYPTCTGGVGVSASGGLGDAWTINTANPLPTPVDTNPSAAQGDLPSSNLDLTSASSGSTGGCWGATNILASTSTTSFGSGSSASMTLPSTWVNGGKCAYGTLGSNSAGGNTDTPALSGPTGDAACPPDQADVNAGYVDCTEIVSSGNDENGSVNYSSLDLFYTGQPVPQTPTATLSASTVVPGGTVTVTGGTDWWGSPGGAPNAGPYGDDQNNSYEFYPVSAPTIYIGTSRGTAVPVSASTVTIPANTYVCSGAESTTVGPNPCTLTVGQPTGTFQVPSSLASGQYNVYIDESNTSPLPGNGPNDSYQTTNGTNLGTAESSTPLTVEGLLVVKTSTTSGYGQPGQTLNYNYAVTNDLSNPLTNITVNDNLIPSANISCPSSTLAADSSETCTGSYVTTQADVDRGYVTNTATVSGTTVNSTTDTSAPSSATVYANQATNTLTLVKSTTSTGFGAAGQTLNYSYLVTNTGTTTLNSIGVSDNKVASVNCPDSTLAPGASETCTGSYTTVQADVDNGSVTNTATASGTNDSNVSTTSSPSSVTVDANEATSSLELAKSAVTSGYGAAGETLDYDYTVTNTGTTTESNIAVSDNLIGTVSCPDPSLAPNASETCVGSYTTTQADVDNGSVTNTATASSDNPSAQTITSNTSSATVDANQATSSLGLVKSSTTSGYGAAGDMIDYDYVVTNTGTTTESNIAVSDNLVSDVNCPDPSLAPNASETCTGSYTVTQQDVDTGSVMNTATASGTNPQDSTITSSSSSVTVPASDSTSSLDLVKSSLTSAYGAAGDTITYNYAVENTGTVTINNITVSDNLVASVSCPDASLAPTASETCSGTYTATQADVDAGSVTNQATANGTDAHGQPVASNQSSVTVPAGNATSSLSLTKASTTTSYDAAGVTIPYTYVVTNTGTRTISEVGVSDTLISNVSCPDSTLAPSDSETCTGSYVTTQDDLAAGSVQNKAQATGFDSQDNQVLSNSSAVIIPSTYTTTQTTPSSSTSALGTTNTDVASITGNDYSANPTGTVQFYECGPTDGPTPCTSTSDPVGDPVTVTASGSDGAVATSPTFAANATGYWCFGAVYSGDSNYSSSSDQTSDECYEVSASTSTTQTTPASSTIALGDSNTDSVTVTGTADGGSPTGTVSFYECGPTNGATPCTSQANQVGNAVSLTGGANATATATSASFTPSSPGFWCFAGYYSGDSNYATSQDASVDECFDVTQVASSTTTTPATTPLVLGNSDSDSAVVTGNSTGGSPTGTVSFYECGPTATAQPCTSQSDPVGSPVDVTAGSGHTADASSGSFTPSSTGFWCFAGYYSGDSNYLASSDSTVDECVDVTAAGTSTTTAPDTSTIFLGQSDTDTATVTGNDAGGSPTGSVTFYECGPTNSATPCTSKANEVGTAETLSPATGDSSFAESGDITPTSTGYWCFAGYYSGDGNYSASNDKTVDECVDVEAATPTVTTKPTLPSITLGDLNSDGATVTGNAAGGSPTGTVTFYECGPTASAQDCTSQGNQVGSPVDLVAGANDTATATSASITPSATGYWCFAGYYSGDSNYTSGSDATTEECFEVNGASTTTVSNPSSSSVTLGASDTDKVTVTGNPAGGAPTGTVDFYECGPTASAQDCTSQANEVGTGETLAQGGGDSSTATSATLTPHEAGYYCFGAYYMGDANYAGSSDTSVTECFDVTEAGSTTTSTPANLSINLGQTDSDNVSVAGITAGGAPTGTVTFYECGSTATAQSCTSQANEVGSAENLTAGAGDVSYASSASFTPASAGYYCFGAYYSGDGNYSSSSDTSTDECFDVVASAPPTITSISPVTGPVGTKITITGTNLGSVTQVTLNGKKVTTTLTINKIKATKLKVTVTAGSKSGYIEVYTPDGNVTSTTKFKVTA